MGSPPFFLRDSRASGTRARVKITPRGKGETPFLAWGDFHARSRFAHFTIPEDKWGTTRNLRLKLLTNQNFRDIKKHITSRTVLATKKILFI